MEFRVLQYFLTVAREESISRAAEALHLSQPTLSRQLKDLEDELGKTLMIRGNRKITLTEEGMLLKKRAQEIIDLAMKTEAEINQSDVNIAGDVWVGAGEFETMRLVAKTICSLREDYPYITVHILSGNLEDILERLEKGLIDYAVGTGSIDPGRYSNISLPSVHVRGLLMRKDSLLASKATIKPDDMLGIPVIAARNVRGRQVLSEWMGKEFNEVINVVATFNLIYNAALMVEEGLGYAISMVTLDGYIIWNIIVLL